MTAHIARSASGHLEKTTNGHLALCGAGCPYPTMLLTVTGTTGTINWCGETWTLPADSGVQKEVCPDTYAMSKDSGTTYGSVIKVDGERWAFSDELTVWRSYQNVFLNTEKLNQIGILGVYSLKVKSFGVSFTTTITNSALYPIVKNIGLPSYSDGRLTADFFDSTTISGITYAWEKGTGW